MTKRIIYYILLLFLLADISYSFVQHLKMPLDGNMAAGIIPSNDVKKIFEDPFGISVITKNAVYPNPNRFFAHWTFSKYFLYTPIALQNIVNPIDSIYLSCAFAKIVIQILIITLLAFCITGNPKIFSKEFLIGAVLIVPLFQVNGYRSYMGIIDPSVTYTFFYALPCALLLLFYYPFFKTSYYRNKFTSGKIKITLLLCLAVIVVLNGPLNPGVILIISLLYVLNNWRNNYAASTDFPFFQRLLNALNCIPKPHLFFFILIGILSIYSLLIGVNNSIFIGDSIPVHQRFYRLPLGLYYLITQKIGFPVLLLMIIINSYLISKYYKNTEGQKILNILKWICIFASFYIILLPLGGYKSYRPYILRYDTIMPVTILLIFIYGKSTYFLIKNLTANSKKMYISFVIVFSFIFIFADQPEFEKNECEIAAIKTISQSKENIVLVKNDCTIMAWEKFKDPNESELNAQLFNYWGLTNEKKLYYQK